MTKQEKVINSLKGKGAVMSTAYWVELNGGNILIVVADSVGDACDLKTILSSTTRKW